MIIPPGSSIERDSYIPSSFQAAKFIVIALALSTFIGAGIANGLLFSKMGYVSFAIGGAGLIIGTALLSILLCKKRATQPLEEDDLPEGEPFMFKPAIDIGPFLQMHRGKIEATQVTAPFETLVIEPGKEYKKYCPCTLPPGKISDTSKLSAIQLYFYFAYLAVQHPNILLYEPPLEKKRNPVIEIEELSSQIVKDFQQDPRDLPYVVGIGDHWTLVYIDRKKQTIEYYDSLVNYRPATTNAILEEIAKTLNLKLEYKITEQLQFDGYQCGMWVLWFLEMRLKDPTFVCKNINIAEYRQAVGNIISRMYALESSICTHERSAIKAYYNAFNNTDLDADAGETLDFYENEYNKLSA
ncbi:MAG TPA: Ulp1 family isopeptidase, partial [Waddliaceae bacterium]